MAKKTKEIKILSAMDILMAVPELTKIEIEGLNGVVFVKEFNTNTRKEYLDALAADTDFRSVVIVNGVCDAEGEPLFTADDVVKLRGLRSDIHDRLYNGVLDVSKKRINNAVKK